MKFITNTTMSRETAEEIYYQLGGAYTTRKYHYNVVRDLDSELKASRVETRLLGTTAIYHPTSLKITDVAGEKSTIESVDSWDDMTAAGTVRVYRVWYTSGLVRVYRDYRPRFVTNFINRDDVSLHKVNSACVEWRIDH